MNIVLGIVGAAIASWLFGLVGISFGRGWLGYLIAGFIGAVILIFVVRVNADEVECAVHRGLN